MTRDTQTAPADRAVRRFRHFAWWVLAYNLLVIAWGAFVRATGAGAGCGSHWPLCNGEVLPRAESVETLVEFSHRLTSGLDGLLVLGLLVAAFRLFPRRHPVRFAAGGAFLFLIAEALIGAGLVRFELVVDNASTARAFVMAAHLVNTFLLLAFLALTADWTRRPRHERGLPLAVARRDPATWVLGGAVAGMLLLGVSGAVAALGDTLFPVSSFKEGWAQKMSPTAHAFVKLRIWHPAIALAMALYLLYATLWTARNRPAPAVRRRGWALGALFALQLVIGTVNVLLAAPVWLQLVHLVAADLVWLALVLLGAAALALEVAAPQSAAEAAPYPATRSQRSMPAAP